MFVHPYPLALDVENQFLYLNTSINCSRNLLCARMISSRSSSRWLLLWFLITEIIFVAALFTFSILSMSCLKCENLKLYCTFEMWTYERFVQWKDYFFILVLEVSGNEPQYSVGQFGSFYLFVSAILSHW